MPVVEMMEVMEEAEKVEVRGQLLTNNCQPSQEV